MSKHELWHTQRLQEGWVGWGPYNLNSFICRLNWKVHGSNFTHQTTWTFNHPLSSQTSFSCSPLPSSRFLSTGRENKGQLTAHFAPKAFRIGAVCQWPQSLTVFLLHQQYKACIDPSAAAKAKASVSLGVHREMTQSWVPTPPRLEEATRILLLASTKDLQQRQCHASFLFLYFSGLVSYSGFLVCLVSCEFYLSFPVSLSS